MRFVPDGGPTGGDVRCLAASGGVFWAGTASGVFRGASLAEGWALDGLSGKPVSSVAILNGEAWAATGEELWRRSAAGTWTLEMLPSAVAFPMTVVVDASGVLWVGGLGVWRRTGETWTTAPSPGVGIVTAMLADPSGLVVGLSTGIAARWTGASWISLSGGVGPAEGFRALAAFGGTLWAGTNVTLYAWNGSSWVADAAFGGHDVRALTTWGGLLRAATADAGALARNGSVWAADRSGVLSRGGQAYLDLGSELLLGTVGGGLYRRQGSGWTPLVGPNPAAVVTDVVALDPSIATGWAAATSLGGGAALSYPLTAPFPDGPPELAGLPDGCGEATAVARTTGTWPEVLVATSCGPYVVTPSAATAFATGLSPVSFPTTLASHSGAIFGGTATSGLWRFSGASWSAEPVAGHRHRDGDVLRSFSGSLWVAMAEGLFSRGSGPWAEVSAGLPSSGLVVSLGGDAGAAFAGLATGASTGAGGELLSQGLAGPNSGAGLLIDLSWRAALGGSGTARPRPEAGRRLEPGDRGTPARGLGHRRPQPGRRRGRRGRGSPSRRYGRAWDVRRFRAAGRADATGRPGRRRRRRRAVPFGARRRLTRLIRHPGSRHVHTFSRLHRGGRNSHAENRDHHDPRGAARSGQPTRSPG
ncbi:MAG: hypothetical protein IPP07_26180 [Holophagales bacterium]|nr:hypothetical protein [Holophagales bacterium]